MWRSFLARVLIWFVALAGLGLYASAQTNAGDIYGIVVDEQGSGIPGGTATLTGPIAPRTTTVDAAGHSVSSRSRPASTRSRSPCRDSTTVNRENVIVTLGKDTNLEFKLKVSNVQESVTVTGETPLLDSRKVETGATFSSDELTRHPDGPRHLVPDAAGAGHPTRHGQRRRQRERHGRRPRLHEQGLGQRHVPGRRRDHDGQLYGNPFRAAERRDEHLLRLRHVPERRGHDGRRPPRAAEPRRRRSTS